MTDGAASTRATASTCGRGRGRRRRAPGPLTTVVTAGVDPLRDGVPTRYENYGPMVHGFMTLRGVDRARDAIAVVAVDLADALAGD
nr:MULTISPECIES: hypothetical protein [Halostella]